MKRFATLLIAIHESDQQRRFSDLSMQFFQQSKIFRDEPRFKNQILGRVAGDCQFRRQHQFGACGGEPLISADDQFAVPSQVPDSRVNLSKTNLHAAVGQIMRNGESSNFLLPRLTASELSTVAHAPDGAVPIFAEENAAIFCNGDSHRAPPDFAFGREKTSYEIL